MFDAWTPERPPWLRSVVTGVVVWQGFLWFIAVEQSWHVQYGAWLWPQLIVGAALAAASLVALWRLNRVAVPLAVLALAFEAFCSFATGRANLVAWAAASLPLVATGVIRGQLRWR